MSGAHKLETPTNGAVLFLAKDDDVDELAHRPFLTGDVIELESGRRVVLIQHPCAINKGPTLGPKVLVCELKASNGAAPADWSKGFYRQSWLPTLDTEGTATIRLDDIDVIGPAEVQAGRRIAILSQLGVNLLLQRWIHHNSRMVIPTWRLNDATVGPYEEADLVAEGVSDLAHDGVDVKEAQAWVERFFGEVGPAPDSSMRESLQFAQYRSVVRSAFSSHVERYSEPVS